MHMTGCGRGPDLPKAGEAEPSPQEVSRYASWRFRTELLRAAYTLNYLGYSLECLSDPRNSVALYFSCSLYF
jgi:hypothetical protein